MTAVNFAEILSKTVEDAPKPKPLPPGMYLCMVQGMPEFPPNGIGQKNTPGAVITLKPVRAEADVDQDALNEAGGLENKTLKNTLWLTEDSLYRVFEFADHLGIDYNGKKLNQVFSEFPNRQVYAVVRHRPSQDGTRMFNEIASTAKV